MIRKGIFIVVILLFSLAMGTELRAENFMAGGPLCGNSNPLPNLLFGSEQRDRMINVIDGTTSIEKNARITQNSASYNTSPSHNPIITSPDSVSSSNQQVVVSNNAKPTQAKTQALPSEWRFAEPVILDPPINQLISFLSQEPQKASKACNCGCP